MGSCTVKTFDPSLQILLGKLGIHGGEPDEALLGKLLSRFSRIPYENITKILEFSRKVSLSPFRTPDRVVGDYVSHGMGGTCFSLVYLFKSLLDYAGFSSYLVLADRSYGSNTHCAVMVRCRDNLYLADPGYLVYSPLRLSSSCAVTFSAGPHSLIIEPIDGGSSFNVFTLSPRGHRKFRYRIRNEEADESAFFDCWKNSFDFEMMNYIVVNSFDGTRHLYLRDRHFHTIERDRRTQREMAPQEIIEIAGNLGMSRQLVRDALTVLGRI
jgi:arylamine N-acetyltransferase